MVTTLETGTLDPVTHLEGEQLKEMFDASTVWLERHVPNINALNVFPVPDGDTGTNMLATMKKAAEELDENTGRSASEVARRIAYGAMLGARGNSGVILSQIFRGLAAALEGKETITSADFAVAMARGAEMAYKAVMKPVEGTILTVIREAAEGAEIAARRSRDLLEVLRATVEAARAAEARTPEFLAVLREAGVTDSGGEGLVVILDGWLRHLRGERLLPGVPLVAAEEPPAPNGRVDPETGAVVPEGEWGYDIQYLIRGHDLDVEAIRAHISSIGTCTLVVGDPTLVKVHVHCPNPGPAIEYGANQGVLFDVVVENMDAQAEVFAGGHEERAPATEGVDFAEATTERVAGIGTVAVASGDGLRRVLESLGVSHVVGGGPTMNPSTADLLEAIEAVEADSVILLPNDKNIILAAEQARELTSKQVWVVPSRTIPAGIAAIMAFNYMAGLDRNVKAMTEALDAVETGEVTIAVRTTSVEGVAVTAGEYIGLHNGKLVVTGESPAAAVRALLDRMALDTYELATFYHGEDVAPDEATALMLELSEAYPALDFDLHEGGQPHYHYIF
ncbi:MAG TPA: DAK2 domain-containing protein, partial [Ardenticatenaceae bacterium]|nr:DAK2 domain-containing protein [Ardenticatenaceae bacterium]